MSELRDNKQEANEILKELAADLNNLIEKIIDNVIKKSETGTEALEILEIMSLTARRRKTESAICEEASRLLQNWLNSRKI